MRPGPIAYMLSAVLLSSCGGFLDKEPFGKPEADTEEKVAGLLVNAYPTYYWAYIAELSSDEADWAEFATNEGDLIHRRFYNWQDVDSQDRDSPHAIWEGCYHAVAQANMALETIREAGQPESLLAYKGEALICRAYSHFILVNLFCKHYDPETCHSDLGIPYMVEVEKTIGARYERGTVENVYALIEKDLTEGLESIDDSRYSVPKYHFNRKAALAFACRYYLYKGDFERVIEISTEILGDDPASVLRDWEAFAEEQKIQGRFEMFIDAGADCNLMPGSFRTAWYSASPALLLYKARNSFLTQKTEGILAPGLWGDAGNIYIKPGTREYDGFMVNKTAPNSHYSVVVPLFTTDEVLLNRAEAYVRLSREKGAHYLDLALEDIRCVVRSFSTRQSLTRETVSELYGPSMDYYTWDRPTPKKPLNPALGIDGEAESFIHALLHLRRAVFIHEGYRWFDIKRYGIEIYRRRIEGETIVGYTDFMPASDSRRAFQIPQTSLAAGLEPNPR